MFMVGCWYTAGIPPVTSGMPLVIKKSLGGVLFGSSVFGKKYMC